MACLLANGNNLLPPQIPQHHLAPQASKAMKAREWGSPMRSTGSVRPRRAQGRAKEEDLVGWLVVLLVAGVGVKGRGGARAARLQQEGRGSEAGGFDNGVIPQINFFLLALQD